MSYVPTATLIATPGRSFFSRAMASGQDARGGGEQCPDGHLAAVAGAQALEFFGRMAQLRQHDLRVPRKDLPVGGGC